MHLKTIAIAAASTICISGAFAGVVYDTVGTGIGTNSGNQDFGPMLGNDFTVNVAGLQVTALGAFNDDLKGISTNITVGLFDLTSNAAVINPISFAGTMGSTTYLFKTLASPVALVAGHQYSVQAFGYNGVDQNYNTNIIPANNGSNSNTTAPITFNSLGGWISNNNSRYGYTTMSAGVPFPHSSTFGAGTLVITAVPEPETYAMMMAGLFALGVVARRRHRQD
jgi:hypothetical protein